jgi:hypothetical protein
VSDALQIARHESAHCCIARILKIEVVLATIDKRAPHIKTRWRDNTAAILKRLAVVDLAATVIGDDPTRCRADERNSIARCMEIVAGEDEPQMRHWPAARRLKERMRAVARRLVQRHATKIERVAAELMRKGRLGQREIDALIAGVTS